MVHSQATAFLLAVRIQVLLVTKVLKDWERGLYKGRYQHELGLNMKAQSTVMDLALDPMVPILAWFPGPFKQGYEQGAMSINYDIREIPL